MSSHDSTPNDGGANSSSNGQRANAPNDEQQNKNNKTKNIKKNAGHYEIFVSKFDKQTTTDDIISRICGSINDIDLDSFSVQKIGGFRRHHTFASFKVSTVSYKICCDIICMDWGQQKAKIFSHRDSSSPRRNNNGRNDNRRPTRGTYGNRDTDRHRYNRRNNNNNNRDNHRNNNNNNRDNRPRNNRRNNYRDGYQRDNGNRRERYNPNRRIDRPNYSRNGTMDDFLVTLLRAFSQQNQNQRSYNRRN